MVEWKNPLDFVLPRKKGEGDTSYLKRLEERVRRMGPVASPPDFKDPGGADADQIRGLRDRAGVEHGSSQYLSTPSIVVDGRFNVDVVESAFDTLTIVNVDQGLADPTWDLTSSGPQVICNGFVLGPIVPGATYQFHGAKRWTFFNAGGPSTLVVYFVLSRAIVVTPAVGFSYGFDPTSKASPIPFMARPRDVHGNVYHGGNHAVHAYRTDTGATAARLRAVGPTDALLVQNDSPIPLGATRFQNQITGLGGALGNVVFVPGLGLSVYVVSVSFFALAPATATRGEWYFLAVIPPGGCWSHQGVKTGGDSQALFVPPVIASPGDTVTIDVYQAGVASPWWATVEGYTI